MTPRLLLLLLLLPSSALAQAVAPAPAPVRPPPVMTPGYFPGSTGNPTHTPAGAGASHGGLAAPEKAAVPRSPNKRLLPPTKEAGLWAADGAKASKVLRTHVFDVDLPLLPAEAEDAESALLSNLCVDTMNRAGHLTGHGGAISKMQEPARTCMASLAYLGCAVQLAERYKSPTKANAIALSRPLLEALKAVAALGRMQVKRHCPEGTMTDPLNDMIEDLLREWTAVMDALQNPLQ